MMCLPITLNDAPIINAVGLAGLALGDRFVEVNKRLRLQYCWSDVESMSYILIAQPIVVVFDELARVIELVAEKGYRGKSKSGIFAGMSWNEMKKLENEPVYSDDVGLWVFDGQPGMGLEIVQAHQFAPSFVPRAGVPYFGEFLKVEYSVSSPNQSFVFSIRVF